ncbi:PspC domain-containing protein [Glaciecola sp. 1036]|uniref:PspC domain-containing protein n=1 Tax=Alteromonadaceae TaxID=72275 RepID=UPI003CFE10EA
MKTVVNKDRFFRDPHKAKISGVCAGLAKSIQIDPWIVRAGAIAAFLFAPAAIGLAYVLAILLLRYRY